MMKIRFLPAMIFMAVLMLTVRLGNVWDGVETLLQNKPLDKDPVFVASAGAQEKDKEEKPPEAAAEGEGAEEAPADETDPEAIARLVTNDPALLTQAEIDLLQRLADRRESLDAREKEMEMREGLLKAAEDRINKKIAELKTFQDTIEGLIKTYDAQQEAKTQSLVKIYESMKPKNAAKIFEEMDMETLLMVTENMKEKKLAAIMAKLNPARATEITVELSRLRDLPDDQANPGG